MFEVTLLCLIVVLIVAYAFLSEFTQQPEVACLDSGLAHSESSQPKLHFLSHLQSEIESALFPRPTDSVLQRHYDALIRAELENRLAAMPDS
ncbi:MAG: hypothetical protein Q7U38_07050 [Methylobacter sp.]|nr:hypothetical protein [Methylobacter sp.]MDP2097424.1 hypothetical protein [Methylobacter sp.]MDP2428620.1 hypothetical protein [Methylobacter sp.]MDP3056456.1 hypothetical protein [Methylobacter sp.]MDP3363202.1 hypothetical protein [Methylobacter sp.]